MDNKYDILFASAEEALAWIAGKHGITPEEASRLLAEEEDGQWFVLEDNRLGLIQKKNAEL